MPRISFKGKTQMNGVNGEPVARSQLRRYLQSKR